LTLDAAVVATDAAAVSLAASGQIDPVTSAMIVAAISPLPGAAQKIVAELSSADSDVVRAQIITATLQPILAKIQALPPTAQAITSACLVAWEAFLAAYPVPVTAARTGAVARSTAFKASDLERIGDHVFKLTEDVSKLDQKVTLGR
jgi:hypothetical protein